jgi:putative sigma-54 modulation protein
MSMIIHGKQLEVTPALKEYIERKVGALQEWFEEPVEIHVTLSILGHRHQQVVEVTIPYHGMVYRAEEKQQDMYASIDLVADKLERRLRKYKEKVQRKLRGRGSLRTQPVQSETVRTVALEEEEDFELLRVKKINLKPVDVQEAILEMNLLDHSFHLFHNKDTNRMEVVYRRNDGSYGLITT